MQDSHAINALLGRLPAEDPERAKLQARAESYAGDCGCKIGAAFLSCSLLLTIVYLAIRGPLIISVSGPLGFVFALAGAAAFIFGAAIAGKILGLLVASLKMASLKRFLLKRLKDRTEAHI